MKNIIKKIVCNICGSKEYKSIFKTKTFDIYEATINKKRHQLKIWNFCKNCKCHFQIKKIDIPDIKNYYSKNYRNKNEKEYEKKFKEIINLPLSESESSDRYKRLLNFLKIKKISKKNVFEKCLDVGCGFGVYAYFLRKNSSKVEGNDLHNNANYLNKYDIKYLNEDFFSLKNKYSLITSNFIVEHLENPMIFLKKSYDLLFKKGILYIEVPSDKAFKYQKKNHDVFNSTHNFIFSKTTLKYMLEKNNFKILKFDHGLNKRNYYYISVYGQKI
jgi:2-polyprenyl-3-methyl-5-hydroxy-6-metoxy-1,4-benzoquinol methylase